MTDNRDLIGAQLALRREFGALPSAVGRIAPGDVPQAETVARHLRLIVELTRHQGQPERLPVLRRRLVELVTRAERWAITTSPADRDALLAAVARLRLPLAGYLDARERLTRAIVETYIGERRWTSALAARAGAVSPRSREPVVVGLMLYDADDAVREIMRSAMTPPGWVALAAIGRCAYAVRAKRLYGTRTPLSANAYR